ncbi:hypothetical protein MLD38_026504 [Melastoma candidum]|uniref:Uncharacterized protein n=1 Tax=Melastoma candidum TaxID=119954 RepID=A0ACB9P0C9_9MYRT|nr:hypothetical protein MLD38_026504 [Melastoma candidum]
MQEGHLPEFSSFYMLAEGLCALSREDTLIELIDLVMEKANMQERQVSMVKGFLKIGKFQDALATLGGALDEGRPGRGPWRSRAYN